MSSLFSIGEDELDLDDEVSVVINSKIVSFSIYVVVNFLFQVIFVFLLFLGMVMYANEICIFSISVVSLEIFWYVKSSLEENEETPVNKA